ncbi:hypothetical protein [Leptospira koniambonensis]|uniref:hypothetical protein n=1 Tax=Leptospira koniambonensis TaxID=2484950 RepID=UPI003EBA2593
MSAGLFGFIFNTLRKRANDPQNSSLWIPKKLQEASGPNKEGKLLPLSGSNWDLGSITGEAGDNFQNIIKSQWWISKVGFERRKDPELKKHQPIACPENPYPKLSMPEVTINGLENVYILPNPIIQKTEEGYNSILSIKFAYYQGKDGLPSLENFRLEGKYCLEQNVCSAPLTPSGVLPSQCDSWYPSENIKGEGDFTLSITDLYADLVLNVFIEGKGSSRILRTRIETLSVRGEVPDSDPTFSVDDLNTKTDLTFIANNLWLPKAKDAIESEDGRRGIVSNLNQTLNQTENLQKLSQMLENQLIQFLDNVLGEIPNGFLPSNQGKQATNPVDRYVFDRVRFSLNDPKSDYYLPKMILKISDPSLEPYIFSEISLGNQSVNISDFGTFEFQNILLQNMKISGLSNAVALPETLFFRSKGFDLEVSVSSLNPSPEIRSYKNKKETVTKVPSPPLQIRTSFSMYAEGIDDKISGDLEAKISKSKLIASVDFEGEELEALEISFSKLQYVSLLPDISVKILVESAYQDIISSVLNQDSLKQKALDAGNSKAVENLKKIGQFATDDVKKIISSKLDG